jgi:hypothetical protein
MGQLTAAERRGSGMPRRGIKVGDSAVGCEDFCERTCFLVVWCASRLKSVGGS